MSPREETFIIDGPAGALEIRVDWPVGASGTAIVCHPHPEHGGTMDNKVVTTLVKAFSLEGMNTLRFNFRGVGKSEGSFAEGKGETDDLLAVIEWVNKQNLVDPRFLCGFSFGASVVLNALNKQPELKPDGVILVAPPIYHFLEEFTSPPPNTLVIQSDDDEVVASDGVYEWVERCDPKPELMRFYEAGHFFHGCLVEMRDRVGDWLSK